MLSPELQAEYVNAMAEVGPSITRIASWMERDPGAVRKDISNDKFLRALYKNEVDMILDAIDRFGANLTVIARMFEKPRHVVEAWISDDPRLRVAFFDFRESMVDIAEHQVLLAAQRGEPWAVNKILSTLGADRGWAERRQIDLTAESARLGVNLQAAVRELAEAMASQPAGFIEGEVAESN